MHYAVQSGVLYSSGMIAGEGIIGIALALFAIFGIDKKIDLASKFNLSPAFLTVSGIVLFAVSILVFLKATLWAKRNKASNFGEEANEQ